MYLQVEGISQACTITPKTRHSLDIAFAEFASTPPQVTKTSLADDAVTPVPFRYTTVRQAGTFKTGTVRPLLSAVLERTKFWTQKPRINEVRG